MSARSFKIHPADNVATMVDDTAPGPVECLGSGDTVALAAIESIARGHKIALQDLVANEAVIKFGARIGHATQAIKAGAWVHLHNLASDLDRRSDSLDRHSGAPTDTSSAYV